MNRIVAGRYVGERASRASTVVVRRRAARFLAPPLVGVLALATMGCSAEDRRSAPTGKLAPSASASVDPGVTGPVPTASAGQTGSGPTATPAGQPGNAPGQPGTATSAGPADAASPVRITSFRVKQKPSCPQGASEFPVEAVPLTLEWKVSGAERVELAVDGPGLYGTYPAIGTESFTFSCGGVPGSVENHTYKLTAKHGTYVDTRTVTASATVYDIAGV
ncbi:hypothetical protein BDK92_3427 [Micromonospora pisi]|uniref:Uncharacterized protein n=1 Tax=Micromonospora pisi TaxID=589240 RepID=A0A495JJ46_9ACTN|nr:hypothetical protein [Micromonospora pisi]RKR89090.1 hypothetical protein BDK92_3427 [Micromonospora pisi]